MTILQFAYNPDAVYNVCVHAREEERAQRLHAGPRDRASTTKIISVPKVPSNYNVYAVDRVYSMDKGRDDWKVVETKQETLRRRGDEAKRR